MEQCRGGCSHEMVNSPATAATMAYPTLEEERRSSWHEHGRDHDHRRRHRQHDANQIVDHHETEILRRDLVSFYAVYSSSVEQHDNRHVHDEPCTGCSSRDSTSTLLNRDFAHSYRAVLKASKGQSATEPSEFPWLGNTQNKPYERRPRKQSQPRKVTGVQEFDEEDMTCSEEENQEKKLEETTSSPAMECPSRPITLIDMKARYRNQQIRRKLLKCHLCPKDAPARGSICSAYHTKVSLILHKLWRHRRNEILRNWVARESSLSQLASITLKATVFTNPGYEYDR